jgi:hypothetical protein
VFEQVHRTSVERRPRDGTLMDGELRCHGEYGWEFQFLYNGNPAYGRR